VHHSTIHKEKYNNMQQCIIAQFIKKNTTKCNSAS